MISLGGRAICLTHRAIPPAGLARPRWLSTVGNEVRHTNVYVRMASFKKTAPTATLSAKGSESPNTTVSGAVAAASERKNF
jgi:hypothetical protein